MLSEAEYRHIISNRNTLQQRIDQADVDEDYYDGLKKDAHARKETLIAEMLVYNGFLGDALEEYEEANPPEE